MFPLKNSIRIPYAPLTTYFLIAVNALVFFYQISLAPREAYAFSLHYALVPRRYFDPAWAQFHNLSPHDYLPFIAGTFMHGGWWHLILNMWTLFIFGTSLEGRIGRFGFLSFYLVCGLAASLVHAYFNQGFARADARGFGGYRGRARRLRDHISQGADHDPHFDRLHSAVLQNSGTGLCLDLVRVSILAGLYRPRVAVDGRRDRLVGAYRRVCRGADPDTALAVWAGPNMGRVRGSAPALGAGG